MVGCGCGAALRVLDQAFVFIVVAFVEQGCTPSIFRGALRWDVKGLRRARWRAVFHVLGVWWCGVKDA